MIYQAYQAYADAIAPLQFAARATMAIASNRYEGTQQAAATRRLLAACELLGLSGLSHERPAFGIESVRIDDREVPVEEHKVLSTPFGSLLRFRKPESALQPRVLLVAPLSGHFSTLLRGTVRTLLRDHDVYITDWHNARDVPLSEGRFDLDDFVDHLRQFLRAMGAGSHLVAVCQPCVGALAATAVMAEERDDCAPRSLTLMAGPIDTRINPTEVNRLATSHTIEWFERNLIARVPWRYPGAFRRVYPGFLQISAFMSMNLGRHAHSFSGLYQHRLEGRGSQAAEIRSFYEEYFAMMDLPAEFYLQTVREVFQQHSLPRGTLEYRGRRVDPGAIRRTALLTVEGEKDDICSVGQTLAAQDLCTGIRPYMKQHLVQTGAGHYGVFNGRRWDQYVYPQVRDFIHVSS